MVLFQSTSNYQAEECAGKMDRSLKVLWFLVCLELGTAQYSPGPDFSKGCTVPSEDYGPPILLPPYFCHLVVRESARALGLLQSYAPMPNYNQQQQSVSTAMNPTFTNPFIAPITVGRAIECSNLEPPTTQTPMQTGRFVDCNQQQAVEGNPPLRTSRAVDCNLFPNMPDCYNYAPLAPPPPQPQSKPVGRPRECSQMPIPVARFAGCPPITQDAEPVTPPPCPQFRKTFCTGCQPNAQPVAQASVSQAAEGAMVDLGQAGRVVNGLLSPSQHSYNLIPIKLTSKTPGAEDQPTQLLLLQLKSDANKLEKEEASPLNIGRTLTN